MGRLNQLADGIQGLVGVVNQLPPSGMMEWLVVVGVAKTRRRHLAKIDHPPVSRLFQMSSDRNGMTQWHTSFA